jgi:hypothetical protein
VWQRKIPGFLPLDVVRSQLKFPKLSRVMESDRKEAEEKHCLWPELGISRAVSRCSETPPREISSSESSLPVVPGTSGQSGYSSTDARTLHTPCPREQVFNTETSVMGDHVWHPTTGDWDPDGNVREGESPDFVEEYEEAARSSGTNLPGDSSVGNLSTWTPRQFLRSIPPPPLIPATFIHESFLFENRRPSDAVSIHPILGNTAIIYQPNQDYGTGFSSSADAMTSTPASAEAIIPDTSYTKSISTGIPIPTPPTSASTSASATFQTAPIQIPGATSASRNLREFSPSSYPPRSPSLPPPPPTAPPNYVFVGGPGGPGVMLSQHEMVNMQGEVVSVVDEYESDWMRHTRVYGGGPCLACAAAVARDGDQAGGFYGENVPLEDRRRR